jgi:hypothetical protein
MNTPEVRTQSKPRTAHQNILKFKEEWEMKTATLTAKVNMRLSERLAKTPVKLLAGLALGALVMTATALPFGTTYADEPARPLSSGQTQCYPEDNVVCLYGPFLADVLPDPALAAGTSISGVQFEEWAEAGFDSYTYHRFMVEQGKVGRVDSAAVGSPYSIGVNEVWTEIEDTPILHLMKQLKVGSPSSIDVNEVWSEIEDTPVFHLMKQLKAASPSSVDVNEVWSEIEDTPVFHLMNQLKAASPRVSKQTECYPELQIC